MKLTRQITGAGFNEKSIVEIRTYKNETGRAKHNRRARLQHITDAKPLEFMAIAKREAFKELRANNQREERRAKRR